MLQELNSESKEIGLELNLKDKIGEANTPIYVNKKEV